MTTIPAIHCSITNRFCSPGYYRIETTITGQALDTVEVGSAQLAFDLVPIGAVCDVLIMPNASRIVRDMLLPSSDADKVANEKAKADFF